MQLRDCISLQPGVHILKGVWQTYSSTAAARGSGREMFLLCRAGLAGVDEADSMIALDVVGILRVVGGTGDALVCG